jgi:PilZ domain-containing protein
MDRSKLQEHHEEKRDYPRIILDSPVNILYKLHQLEARIHDISPDGLQIRADSDSLMKINPENEEFTEANAPLLDITFCLKLYEMDMRINALCKIYYSNISLDDKDVAYGLKFINFEGDGSSQLEAFITQEMTIY